MDYEKILKDLEDEAYRVVEKRKNWSIEKKEEIQTKEQEMTRRVKEKLDNINYKITGIMSTFLEGTLLKDEERRDIIKTTFFEPTLGNMISVITDSETLEMLYVQTGPTNFVDVDEFFKQRE